MFIKRIITFVSVFFLIFISPIQSATQQKKVYILLYGTFNLVQKMGNIGDYVPGENDFPITPAHFESGGGLGLFINISHRFAIQLSSYYLFGNRVNKEDPSDGETVTYKTYNNINTLGSVIVKVGSKPQFFICGGGGFNVLIPYPQKEVEGSLGSIIILQPPDKKINPMVGVGGGVILNFKKMILKLEALYTMILRYEKNSILIHIGFGF